MKFCDDAEWLAAYLDRRLSEADRRIYETHLSACPRCLAELINAKAELDGVRADELCAADAGRLAARGGDLAERLRGRPAGGAKYRPTLAGFRRRALAIGLSVLLFAAGAAYLGGVFTPDPIGMREARKSVSKILETTEIGAMRLSNGPSKPVPQNALFRGPDALSGNRLERIERNLRRASDRHPGDWRPYALLGDLYLARGQAARARDAYTRSLTVRPHDAGLLNDRAVTEYRLGMFDSSLTDLRQAASVKNPPLEVLYNLGVLCHERGDGAKSREYFDAYRAKDPSSEWAERAKNLSGG